MEERPIVVLGFDMETDIGSFTPFYEGVKNGTARIVSLLERHDVQATFFFTGEAAEQNPTSTKMVAEKKHDVGCHSLYHETVGDELFPIPGVKPLLPEEVFHRLEVATEKVAQIAEARPVSFRAPRLWGSTAMVNALEKLGYLADASYPLYFYGEQLAPYHPSPDDWTKKGSMKILEIPNFADMTIESKDQYGRDRDQWPLFRTEGADALMVHVENFVRFVGEKGLPAVLCFYFHPWEFIEMPQGPIHYGEGSVIPDPFIVKNCGDPALGQLNLLLGRLTALGASFQTAQQLALEWNELLR